MTAGVVLSGMDPEVFRYYYYYLESAAHNYNSNTSLRCDVTEKGPQEINWPEQEAPSARSRYPAGCLICCQSLRLIPIPTESRDALASPTADK